MRRIKRVFICLLCFSLLLSCFAFSAAADSFSRSGTVAASNMKEIYIESMPYGTHSYGYVTAGYWDGYNHLTAHPDTGYGFNGLEWYWSLDMSHFANIDPFETYHLRFDVMNWVKREYEYEYSLGLYFEYAENEYYEVATYIDRGYEDNEGDYLFFDVMITPSFWEYFSTMEEIRFLLVYEFPNMLSISYEPYMLVSDFDYSCLTAEENAIVQSGKEIQSKIEQGTKEIKDQISQGTDQITGEIQDQTEQQKGFFQQLGDRIGGFFEKLLSGIIDGLKKLFIPDAVVDPATGETVDYFTYYFDQWDEWMNDHFGVLYFPFAILFDTLDHVLSFTPPANPTITFPKLEIMGMTLLEPIVYDFETFDMPWLNTAHDLYLFAVDALIGFWLVRLAYKKLTEIMGGGS